jgi:endonuclease/exonuclease/phosphatase family metal-dependent hydrolase
MKKIALILLLACFFSISFTNAQEKRAFKVHTIAFYNVENLFDPVDDPDKLDERSPIMAMNFDRDTIYKQKVQNMARVIADIGADVTKNTPAIIGLAEVENRKVIEDLANDEALLQKDYGIVHFDSPDERGIDVALMYQKSLFTPVDVSKHELKIYDDNTSKRIYTRDQLLVSGKLEGELIHVIVNHWPSRRGGTRSIPKRVAAAKLNKRIIDSLQAINPYAKVFTMGDLNDNPTDKSVKRVLKAEAKKENVALKGIYNPYENLYKKQGLGTTGYRDNWSLFDQILVTKPLLEKDYTSFRFYKAGIFNVNYLTNKKGRYKGYPFRSFVNNTFTNGFSDHFPVYVHVIKTITNKK